MDYNSTYNYFYNLINCSLHSVNSRKEYNQNLYTILSPFYSSLANNSKDVTNKSHQINDHEHLTRKQARPFQSRRRTSDPISTQNVLQRSRSHERLRQSQIVQAQRNYPNNLDQTMKTQNLNNVLNKIHNFKSTNVINNITRANNVQGIPRRISNPVSKLS